MDEEDKIQEEDVICEKNSKDAISQVIKNFPIIILLIILLCSLYMIQMKKANSKSYVGNDIINRSSDERSNESSKVAEKELSKSLLIKKEYTKSFIKYMGEHVESKKVKELLDKIDECNNQIDNWNDKILIDVNISKDYSKAEVDCIIKADRDSSAVREILYDNRNYIVSFIYEKGTEIISGVVISGEQTSSREEINKFNDPFERYVGEYIEGKRIKELLKLVLENNIKEKSDDRNKSMADKDYRVLGVLIHIGSEYTNSKKNYYEESQFTNNIKEYIQDIKKDKMYNVQIYKYNPEGYVSTIRISDKNTYNMP